MLPAIDTGVQDRSALPKCLDFLDGSFCRYLCLSEKSKWKNLVIHRNSYEKSIYCKRLLGHIFRGIMQCPSRGNRSTYKCLIKKYLGFWVVFSNYDFLPKRKKRIMKINTS